jgi:hypothetical protein
LHNFFLSCCSLSCSQELLHQRSAWDQLLSIATDQPHLLTSTVAATAAEGGTTTQVSNFLTTHELLKFQILEQPMPNTSSSAATGAPARPSSGASAASGGVGSTASNDPNPHLQPVKGGSSSAGHSGALPTANSIQSSITQSSTTSSDAAIPKVHGKGGSSNSADGNSGALPTATSIQSSITQSSTTSAGGLDRTLVVHRAFAMLASRCMDPDPTKRPTFGEVIKKVDVMRRALMNTNVTVHSQ